MLQPLLFEATPTRADQIYAAFAVFHGNNPMVWELFEFFALEAIRTGKTHYSSNAIFERIRWHIDIETSGDEVKLNNNFRAYYARMFHVAHPTNGKFFRNRKRKSDEQGAREVDQQVFIDDDPDAEDELAERLSRLVAAVGNQPRRMI